MKDLKIGQLVKINKNLTRYNKEAHGFNEGDLVRIISINNTKNRAIVGIDEFKVFSIKLEALDII